MAAAARKPVKELTAQEQATLRRLEALAAQSGVTLGQYVERADFQGRFGTTAGWMQSEAPQPNVAMKEFARGGHVVLADAADLDLAVQLLLQRGIPSAESEKRAVLRAAAAKSLMLAIQIPAVGGQPDLTLADMVRARFNTGAFSKLDRAAAKAWILQQGPGIPAQGSPLFVFATLLDGLGFNAGAHILQNGIEISAQGRLVGLPRPNKRQAKLDAEMLAGYMGRASIVAGNVADIPEEKRADPKIKALLDKEQDFVDIVGLGGMPGIFPPQKGARGIKAIQKRGANMQCTIGNDVDSLDALGLRQHGRRKMVDSQGEPIPFNTQKGCGKRNVHGLSRDPKRNAMEDEVRLALNKESRQVLDVVLAQALGLAEACKAAGILPADMSGQDAWKLAAAILVYAKAGTRRGDAKGPIKAFQAARVKSAIFDEELDAFQIDYSKQGEGTVMGQGAAAIVFGSRPITDRMVQKLSYSTSEQLQKSIKFLATQLERP